MRSNDEGNIILIWILVFRNGYFHFPLITYQMYYKFFKMHGELVIFFRLFCCLLMLQRHGQQHSTASDLFAFLREEHLDDR